jgi:quinol monooxygenase YgiN
MPTCESSPELHTLCVELHAKPGSANEVETLMRELIVHAASEDGTLAYTLHKMAEHEHGYLLVEIYRSREDFDTHFASAPVQRALSTLPELLLEAPRLTHGSMLASTAMLQLC